MKKISKINWEQDRQTFEYSKSKRFSKLVWDSIAILLTLISAALMYTDFSEDLQLEKRSVIIVGIVVFVTQFIREIVYTYLAGKVGDKRRGCLKFAFLGAILLIGVLVYGRWYLPNRESINGGLLALADCCVDRFNWVFCTNYVVKGTLYGYLSEGLLIATIMSYFIFFLISGFGKRKGIFAGLPILMASLILYLGIAPGRDEFLLMALGIFMLYRSKKKDEMVFPDEWVKALVVLGVFVLVSFVSAGPLQSMYGMHDKMKQIELSIERSISEFASSRHAFENKRISNNTPRYQDAKIVKIKSSVYPSGSLYLKEFYSYNYENGMWTDPANDFEEKCLEAGVDAKYATQLNLPENSPNVTFENEYYGVLKKELLASYGAVFENGENVSFLGDSLMLKDRLDRSIKYKGYFTNELTEASFFPSNVNKSDETGDAKRQAFEEWYFSYIKEQCKRVSGYTITEADDYEEYELYNDLTECILDYIDMDLIREDYDKVKEKIDEEDLKRSSRISAALIPGLVESRVLFNEMNHTVEIQLPFETFETVYPIEEEKTYRAIKHVARFLRNEYSYSWDLDEIDKYTDPIKYFLTEGKRGYCVHFASAGVLLLREYGIPARYASGYLVNPSMFTKQKDGTYVAEVIDRNAHAWVEIYLSGIGWVPVEMTPGYGEVASSLDEVKDGDTSESLQTKSSQEESKETLETSEMTETSDESQESEEVKDSKESEESEEEKESDELNESQKGEDNGDSKTSDKTTNNKKNASSDGKGSNEDGIAKTSLIKTIVIDTLVCALGIGIVIILCYVLYLVRTRELKYALQKKNYKKVVRAMNHRIYKRVHGLGSKAKDKEFEKELAKKLLEIESKHFYKEDEEYIAILQKDVQREVSKYMRIVKAAAFSKKRLTKDEYRVVKTMYRRICGTKRK